MSAAPSWEQTRPRKLCRFCGRVIRGDSGACVDHLHLLAEDYRYMQDAYLDERGPEPLDSPPVMTEPSEAQPE